MELAKLNQEKRLNLLQTLNISKNIALFVFDEEGKIDHVNQAVLEILGVKDEKELISLNIQKIFDLRISEILDELKSKNEISRNIRLICSDKSCTEIYTTFLKLDEGILALFTLDAKTDCSFYPDSKLVRSLDCISNILNSTLELDDTFELILNNLKSIIDYDKSLVVFLEGDNLTLKASRNMIDSIDEGYHKFLPGGVGLFNKIMKGRKTLCGSLERNSDSFSEFINVLGFHLNTPCSYVIAPLTIRETLFGMIILIKNLKDFFTEEDIRIAQAFASSAAYSVKDAELSNVFKMQLKILKDNVVERTKSLEVIKEQNLKILEADKMKNEFLANISHELRTPLNAIIGFSEALKLKIFGDLNQKQEEYIDDIHTSGIHLLGMINDLLDLSKIEAKEMHLCKKDFQVINAINEVLNVTRAIVDKKKIVLSLDCTDKELKIHADYTKFQQILYNLISNAAKFTPENGKISIVIIKLHNNLSVSVEDNGIGIDPKYHNKIFQKFQQLDSIYARKQGSTGLGLTITKELVEMHGGHIWVESELNKGAKFTFEIPFSV